MLFGASRSAAIVKAKMPKTPILVNVPKKKGNSFLTKVKNIARDIGGIAAQTAASAAAAKAAAAQIQQTPPYVPESISTAEQPIAANPMPTTLDEAKAQQLGIFEEGISTGGDFIGGIVNNVKAHPAAWGIGGLLIVAYLMKSPRQQ